MCLDYFIDYVVNWQEGVEEIGMDLWFFVGIIFYCCYCQIEIGFQICQVFGFGVMKGQDQYVCFFGIGFGGQIDLCNEGLGVNI